MSEPYGSWGSVDEPEPPRRNRGLYVGVAAVVLVLAVIGGATGYVLAGNEGGGDLADPGQSFATTLTPSSTAASVSTPSSQSSTIPAGDSFRLPDVTNQDFEQARRQLRNLRLGVTVIFGATGDDRRVERTEPAANQSVRPGVTVKLYVRGRAPMATVPGVVGLACEEAGRLVADHGLVPQYPDGRAGGVLRQDPAPPTDTVRWNDQVRLYCGTASSGSSPTPSPTSS